MSSSPTKENRSFQVVTLTSFQSAVAHELFSDEYILKRHVAYRQMVSKRCRA